MKLTYLHLFVGPDNNVLPTEVSSRKPKRISRLNYIFIKFVINYGKVDGNRIKRTSLKNYILGIQSAFEISWVVRVSLLPGPIFAHPKPGFILVVDNIICKHQADGEQPKSRNLLTVEDIRKLYDSVLLSKEIPRWFMTRLLFDNAFQTGFRLS